MSEKVHEVPEKILEELFLAARATALRGSAAESLADALDFAEKVLSPPTRLLPCPFCGGEAVERRLFGPDGRWWHQCSTCDVETPAYDSEVKAIAAWNRRTAIPSLAAELPPIDRSEGEEP